MTLDRADVIVEYRHRGDSNPCGQSPMDFESISLAARTHCLDRAAHVRQLFCDATRPAPILIRFFLVTGWRPELTSREIRATQDFGTAAQTFRRSKVCCCGCQ